MNRFTGRCPRRVVHLDPLGRRNQRAIAVARQGDRSRAQVARSFGISESCLNRWMKIADRQDGVVQDGGGDASAGAPVRGAGGGDLEAENRELRRRTKQLEQENEILRRATAYFARDTLPK